MTKIIGHRGARGLAPENTLAGLDAGLNARADGLEIDVRVTKEGRVVLHHDPYVKNEAGQKIAIAGATYDELKKIVPDMPTLGVAIKRTDKKVPLMIEIKKQVPVGPVLVVLGNFLKKGWQPEDFMVASRSYPILTTVHEHLPAVPLVVIDAWSGVRASRRARKLGTKYVSMNQYFLWWGFIRGMRSGGYRLFAYTLNSPRRASYWAKHGLYGVITDYPDRFSDHQS